MINVKSEFTKGNIELQEIYDNEYKILETTNNQLWNTNIDYPIIVAKIRLADYEESTTPIDLEKLKKLDELEKKWRKY